MEVRRGLKSVKRGLKIKGFIGVSFTFAIMFKAGVKATIAGISLLLIFVIACIVYFARQNWNRESSAYRFQLSHIVLDSLVKRDSSPFDLFKEQTDSLFTSFIQTHKLSLNEGKIPVKGLDSLVYASKQLYLNSFPGADSLKMLAFNMGMDSTFDISLEFGFFQFNDKQYNFLNHQMDSLVGLNNHLKEVFTTNGGLPAKDFIGGFHIRGNYFHFEFLCLFSPNDLPHSVFKRIWSEMLVLLIISMLVIVFSVLMIKSVLDQKKLFDRKTDFINVITHEFNTPIATIALAAKMMTNEKTIEPSRIQHFSKIIERQNLLLKQIMERLSNRTGVNAKVENLIKVNITGELNQVIEDFRMNHQNDVFTLKTKVMLPENTFILSDHALFGATMFNILENAIKYRKPEITPEILVSAFPEKGNAVITVKDNGIGIEHKDIPYIFEHFYRSGNTIGDGKGGMGMGLYLVRENMRLMKGKVSVTSVPRKGSTFRLQFPICK